MCNMWDCSFVRSWSLRLHCVLLSCNTMGSCRWLPTFRRAILPSYYFFPQDGGSRLVWNVDNHLPDYTVLKCKSLKDVRTLPPSVTAPGPAVLNKCFDGIHAVVLWQTSSNLYITAKHNKFMNSKNVCILNEIWLVFFQCLHTGIAPQNRPRALPSIFFWIPYLLTSCIRGCTGCCGKREPNFGVLLYGPFWATNTISSYVRLSHFTSLRAF